jgi:hypothetical protein
MEYFENLVFPGYVHVSTLAHEIYGSELFFISREDFSSALEFRSGVSLSQFRSAPDHFSFLLRLGASTSSSDVFAMPTPVSVAKTEKMIMT